jgi:cysteine-rich repeat protein
MSVSGCGSSSQESLDACGATCTARCGDGTVQAPEVCDDGNGSNGDGCHSDCTIERCGDMRVDGAEVCDDGNIIDTDACRNNCTLPRCGDGVTSVGEVCDDNNAVGGDGCAADCKKIEVCGDRAIDVHESCDDGNLVGSDGCSSTCNLETPFALRIVAGNLTSGNLSNYDGGHGTRIFSALQADVALVQEMNAGDNSATALRMFVDGAFGAGKYFTRGSGSIPNGVVSRFPIVLAGEWTDPQISNRTFVYARIDLPNSPRDLWAVSLHLSTNGTLRPAEADALVAAMSTMIPANDYLVIGGDLNSGLRTESAIVKLGALLQVAVTAPSDQNGTSFTNAPRNKPFDWVLADPDLQALAVATTIGPILKPSGLVFDTRLFAQTDLGDSATTGMQHMAVVRDFVVQAE